MQLKCLTNIESQTVDVVIVSVPWTETDTPLMAPASLKPIIEKAGLTSLCVDLNAEIYNLLRFHPLKTQALDFFYAGNRDLSVDNLIDELLNSTVEQILSWKPKYIGFSLFTYASRSFCRGLCERLKELSPKTTIIIGGVGALEQFTGPSTFADDMRELGLVDYHIRGDGEHSLYQLLIGNDQYPGINSPVWKEITNEELHLLPFPNYDDYDFSQYQKKLIGIHGSRGCVRSCTFCDYIANWTKFQWRTAESIFEEMLVQYKKYGIRYFKFSDALTNGNLKEFNKLIRLLADYNTSNPNEKIHWGGYYIFREQSANDDEMWNLIAKSGAVFLIVGIENLNEDIRYHIGKKFSNASIDYHLSQAKKHKIGMLLLLIVGYVTETVEHINFSKQWLEDHVEFKDVFQIQWDQSLGIFPNTYLMKNRDSLNIKLGPTPFSWINPVTGSNHALRDSWVKELETKSKELGYNVLDKVDNHYYLEQKLSAILDDND